MAKKLTDNKIKAQQLTTKTSELFKMLLEEKLYNNYDFTILKNKSNMRDFQNLLYKLIGKSWDDVENLYGRDNYGNDKHYSGEQIIHLGEDRKSLRLHGVKRDDKYFVLLRIDPNHNNFSKKK